MARNPPWVRDELILALDLYCSHDRKELSQDHPAVSQLSSILNELPLHLDRPDRERFRNNNGVYMKLSNFRHLDPDYEGIGLRAGGKMDGVIWNEFANAPKYLSQTAEAIKRVYSRAKASETFVDAAEDSFPEGRILYRVHRFHEYVGSPSARDDLKAQLIDEKSSASCMVCGYAPKGFLRSLEPLSVLQLHYEVPPHKAVNMKRAGANRVALACANCHWVLHHHRPWMVSCELAERVKGK